MFNNIFPRLASYGEVDYICRDMIHVKLPDDAVRPLPFYLAMEEYLLGRMEEGAPDAFFMWQVRPTVIFGRNQIGTREVDLDYCREHGIEVYRRKSGGGCVFANMDNIMLSYITRGREAVAGTFGRYTSTITAMLRSLGLDASASTRNDILIGDRKVSGNAYYRTPRGSIVHGTMLFDTDRAMMSRALTPSARKLAAKGVSSAAMRVTTLRSHLDISIDDFKRYAAASLCDAETTLTDADIDAICRLAEPYFSDEWRWGFDRRASAAEPRRVEGAGEFIADIDLDPVSGTIRRVNLAGDFFVTADIDTLLLDRLVGVEPRREALGRALAGVEASQAIAGLSTTEFINLLLK